MPFDQLDLDYLRSSVGSLEDYLLSNEIYWPLDNPLRRKNPTLPDRLSLGGLLLAKTRLSHRQFNPEQKIEVSLIQDRINGIRDRWRAHWIKKAERELPLRINLWENVLSDYDHDSFIQSDDYIQDVRWRVMVELLQQEIESFDPEIVIRLSQLDERLKRAFIPGDFIWDKDLEEGFPKSPFWFLYGVLHK